MPTLSLAPPLAPLSVPLEIAAVCIAGSWRLSVAGELDLDTGATLRSAVAEVAAARPGRVELDLRSVTFVDSAGWRAVGDALDMVAGAGGQGEVSAVSPAVAWVRSLHRPVLARAC